MRRFPAAAFGLLLLCSMLPADAQETLEEARDRREALQAEAARTAADIDVLEAEDADIVAAIERLDAWIVTQEAQLERAEQNLAATLEAEALSRARAEELDQEITRLRDAVTEQSVNAYIQGFTSDDELLLSADDINSVPILRFVLDESNGVSAETTDLLRVALDHQRSAIAEAEVAAATTRQLQVDIGQRIDELESSRAAQAEIRAEIERRIDELEEAADILAEENRQVELFIQEEIARLAAEEERRRREEAARLAAEAEAERAAEAAAAAQEAAEEEAAAAEEAAATPEPTAEPTVTDDEQPAPEEGADDASADNGADGRADAPAEDGDGSDSGLDGGADDSGGGDGGTAEPEPEPTAEADPNGVPTFIPPVPGAVSSGFGNRVHPVYGTERLHAGVDFNGAQGTTIVAAAPGTVIYAGTFSGYGNTVIIQHTGGYSTLYAHMSAFHVSAGATVAAGQSIGLVGSTGLSTGPHLHFEIRLNGAAIDPAPYL